jgi:hypothetical protein
MRSRARIAAWLLVGTAVAGPVAAQGSVWKLDWIQRTPSHSPPTAYAPRMVFDEARGRIILVDMFADRSNDGVNWTQ